MPLSKAKNKERMRKFRLHKQLSSLLESKPVQPKEGLSPFYKPEIDADGNAIPELT